MRVGIATTAVAVAAAVLLLSSAPAGATHSVVFSPTDMEQLHSGEGVYELWAIIDGNSWSIGRFNVDPDGVHINTPGGMRIDSLMTTLNLSAATSLMLTAEPQGDNDATPAHHLLGGSVSWTGAIGNGSLVSSDPNGLGVSFTTASGSFMLTTPTDSTTGHPHFNSGVWFMKGPVGNRTASLVLPTLPSQTNGWQYQGWIQDQSSADPIPYSTGEFSTMSGADRDGGGCGAGTVAPPGFPGQDFLNDCFDGTPVNPQLNQTGAGGWAVVITVEPSPNTGPLPFGFKPLQLAQIPQGVGEGTSVNLQQFASSLPRAAVTVRNLGGTPVAPMSWGAIKALYR